MLLPHYDAPDAIWFAKLAIWWGSWLVPPLLALLAWRIATRWRRWRPLRRGGALLGLLAGLLFVQARFVEPHMIVVRESALGLGIPARIALVGDFHLGLYKGPGFLDRVVDRLNALDVDAVLIAGDYTDEPDRALAELIAPLRRLKAPAYSVPGNHDTPGPGRSRGTHFAPLLREELLRLGVRPVEGEVVDAGAFLVVGLGDHYAGKDQPVASQQPQPGQKPRLVLVHNPDSVMKLPSGWARLALSGHTHGGQLRVPGLYRRLTPTNHGFDRGLHDFAPLPTYVTAGLGETALPMRWMNPPSIDVLDLH
ncbi:metallophosphoesterase [Caldimonas tepidiphila]|uniref:metallophosphoesterase n=1 Tax=Caldimonas tepidiphila TaxID=2315841 RepID=UPI000E5A13CD|nr:metallophosphoesterase [Caldimonas tepidiphila]